MCQRKADVAQTDNDNCMNVLHKEDLLGKGFKVQGSRFRVQGSGFRVQGLKKLGMRNEGGGFAANIYGAMPESGI